MHFRKFKVRLLMIIIAVVASVVAVFLEAPEHPAYALGPGRVCVFFAPTGAPDGSGSSGSGNGFLGHVGWAFRVNQGDDWIYGSTEGTGASYIPPGQYNGSWTSESNWATMKTTFGQALIDGITNRQYHGYHYYTEYRCKNTNYSAVRAAIEAAYPIVLQGYLVGYNDCLGNAAGVLVAYDSNLHLRDLDPVFSLVPILWFTQTLSFYGFEPTTDFSYAKASPVVIYTPSYWSH